MLIAYGGMGSYPVSMRYDVIVVGAGPAGSTAARECAARGLSVLVLDKDAFPRDKPCGGGVTVRAARLLPFDLTPVIERTVVGVRFSLRQSLTFTRRSSSPLTYLTQRSRLDTFLVEQALAAGATLRERASVRSVERCRSHVIVRAGKETFEGRTLVAADGVNGQTAKLAGLRVPRWMAIALEGNVTPAGGVPGAWEDVFGIEIGSIPGGYGWLFPRGDHLNMGVGGIGHAGPSLRASLGRLTRFYGFDPADLWGVRGYPLPVRLPGAPLVDGNVLLAGDAAVLVDPITGEGIFAAICSGRVAGSHLANYLSGHTPDLRGYEREIMRELIPELETADRWGDLIYLAPAAFVKLIQYVPSAWGLFSRMLRGEETYVGFRQRHGGFALGIDLVSGWRLAALRRRHDKAMADRHRPSTDPARA